MQENFEYKGDWFLPSNKDNRVKGILNYDANEGSTLELFGNFGDNLFMSQSLDEDIILGISSDSKEITLHRCFITSAGGMTFAHGVESGTPSTIYSVNFIFVGEHINSSTEMKFNTIISEIHNLDEWIGISGFTPSKINFEDPKKFEIDVHYKLPEQINFIINNELNGQFNFTVNAPGRSIFQPNISITQKVEVVFSSSVEYSLEQFLKIVLGFQNFLVLALYNRTYYTNIILLGDRFIKDYGDGKSARKKIKLYFPISNRSKTIHFKSDLRMLFAYRHIKDEFPSIIKNWYKNYELLEPAFNLLFEQFYNNERFSENTFLNLAQAAETFHARIHNHTKMPEADYDKMKNEIYSVAPKIYHDWLKDQFNFGNNLNLHTRLSEIVSKYSNEILDKIIGDKEDFVKQVKWSRNYYTHYSNSGKKNALKGQQLFVLTEKLKMMLVCAFLIEVGFDKEKLKILLEQNKHRFFHHMIKW